jgi:hypothetical protein
MGNRASENFMVGLNTDEHFQQNYEVQGKAVPVHNTTPWRGCRDKSPSVLNLRRHDQLCPQPPLYLNRKSHLNSLNVRSVT